MFGQIHADFLRLLWVLADKQMRSYSESMGKEDKDGNEAFRWARAKVFHCSKTSVGRAIACGLCTVLRYLARFWMMAPMAGVVKGGQLAGDDNVVDGGSLNVFFCYRPHGCHVFCCAHPCCCFWFCFAIWCCWWICRRCCGVAIDIWGA